MRTLLLLLLVLLPANSLMAQGRCGQLTTKAPAPWFAVDAGGGLALPLPFASRMTVKLPAPLVTGTVSLILPPRLQVGLQVQHKYFEEANSTFQFGRHLDVLGRFGVSPVVLRSFQWTVLALAGTTYAQIQFEEIDPVKPLTKEVNGISVPFGPIKRKNIWALTGGLGTRAVYYPIDALGIYLDISMLYAYWDALKPEEGPATLNLSAGFELNL